MEEREWNWRNGIRKIRKGWSQENQDNSFKSDVLHVHWWNKRLENCSVIWQIQIISDLLGEALGLRQNSDCSVFRNNEASIKKQNWQNIAHLFPTPRGKDVKSMEVVSRGIMIWYERVEKSFKLSNRDTKSLDIKHLRFPL